MNNRRLSSSMLLAQMVLARNPDIDYEIHDTEMSFTPPPTTKSFPAYVVGHTKELKRLSAEYAQSLYDTEGSR